MIPLICTQYCDPHADMLTQEIKLLGIEPFILKRYEDDIYFTAYFSNARQEGWVYANNQKIYFEDIGSIFWRVKPSLPSEIPGTNACINDYFRSKEWMQAIEALELLSINAISINNGEVRRKMKMKLYQKKLALSCGLHIPESIISNSSDDLIEHFQAENLIYKTLSSFFTHNGVIYTNSINKNDIKENKKSIFLAPGIFQAFISKKHELRITIVNEKFFIAKIDSNRNSKTKIDWRYNQTPNMFELGEISSSTKSKLLQFHKKAGLLYATYDFIVNQDNFEIFLECNPSGQWLFLGDYLGTMITKEIAKYMLICLEN